MGRSETLNKIPFISGEADKTPQSAIGKVNSLGLIIMLYIPKAEKVSAGNIKF